MQSLGERGWRVFVRLLFLDNHDNVVGWRGIMLSLMTNRPLYAVVINGIIVVVDTIIRNAVVKARLPS